MAQLSNSHKKHYHSYGNSVTSPALESAYRKLLCLREQRSSTQNGKEAQVEDGGGAMNVYLDIPAKRLFWMFGCVPLLSVVLLLSALRIPETYNVYRALADRGIEVEAEVNAVTISRGAKRRSSVLVAYSYRAVDGVLHSDEDTSYSSEAFTWRAGNIVKILYDRDNPTTSALSLDQSRHNFFWSTLGSLISGCLLVLLSWIFRDDFRAIRNSLRTPAAKSGS